MIEFTYNSVDSYFITLTYDDVHIPYEVRDDCGYLKIRWYLEHPDVYGFLKRLKYHLPKFRYFGVSEYSPGPQYRPHYHILLYLPSPYPLQYVTESVLKSWSEKYSSKDIAIPYGRVQVEKVSPGRISYVTTYMLTKVFNENYNDLPLEYKPKSFMSRRPGIGDRTDNKDLRRFFRENPFVSYMCFPDGSKINIPRYYRERMFPATTKRLRSVLLKINQAEKSLIPFDYSFFLEMEYRRKYYLKSLKRSNNE